MKIKSGQILRDQVILKGAGSAYGGKWRPSPNKPDDQRYLGKPGEIKITYTKKGEKYATKIGQDGRAIKERHYTDHNRQDKHTNPHDHIINWNEERGNPLPGSPINYPNNPPDFKSVKGDQIMSINYLNNSEEDRFSTINEFKWCVDDGGEVEFIWKGKPYSITHPDGKISICQGHHFSEAFDVDKAEELLDYLLGEDKLRDVITQVDVIARTI